ncbi:MAG: hypothetical protein ACLTX3_08845 [Lachnospiraceae bacterium]
MEKYMNAPMEPSWTVQDIIAEYEISKDKKRYPEDIRYPYQMLQKF